MVSKKTNGPLVGLTVGAGSCRSARKAGVESWFWQMAVGERFGEGVDSHRPF